MGARDPGWEYELGSHRSRGSACALYLHHVVKHDVQSFLSLKEGTVLQKVNLNIRTMKLFFLERHVCFHFLLLTVTGTSIQRSDCLCLGGGGVREEGGAVLGAWW